jgi:hypothetical protein
LPPRRLRPVLMHLWRLHRHLGAHTKSSASP